ncbi:MAG TPA: ATP-binding protein [Terriglobia bacterium]|nr:ATP-binding protein [Terriglobia bacterium]
MRLRTKFLLSLLMVSASLTWVTLLVVRHRVRLEVRDEIFEALRNSVVTFQNFQRQREVTLARSAGLMADLPYLKALMTSHDAPTIQDASTDYWRQMSSDLFVLGDRSGKLMALHSSAAGFTRDRAQSLLDRSLQAGEPRDWWFGNGRLYQVFLQPIYSGPPENGTLLGSLAVGYEIDDRLARVVSQVASSQVAFRYDDAIVVSTLTPLQQAELTRQTSPASPAQGFVPQDVQLDGERFLSTSMDLAPGGGSIVSLSVLKSYDRAAAFLESLNRWIAGVGLGAVLVGCVLVFLISTTFTRPLAHLVEGVRALESGDFEYPLPASGKDEVSVVTRAFDRMRRTLQKTQAELLHAERLATIGRMASTISHDLRHPLTAIMAYAEFLSEGNLKEAERRDLYHEIRLAVNQMTDEISSLLGFSKKETLRPAQGNVEGVIRSAIQMVQARPAFQRIAITVTYGGSTEAWFDPGKLQRVFQNLLLNACEAVPPDSGKIEVSTRQIPDRIEIRLADNGPGIPQPVRESLFQPFVSHGKENGIGLGLTVVQKIIQDHGGEISVEETGAGGTVFRFTLPARQPVVGSKQKVGKTSGYRSL